MRSGSTLKMSGFVYCNQDSPSGDVSGGVSVLHTYLNTNKLMLTDQEIVNRDSDTDTSGVWGQTCRYEPTETTVSFVTTANRGSEKTAGILINGKKKEKIGAGESSE